jgi:CheY-like chemotaxis protein
MPSLLTGVTGLAAASRRPEPSTAPPALGDGGRARLTQAAPVLRRPGAVVFVDDDPVFLHSIASIVSARRHCRFFTQPEQVVEHLAQERPFALADRWQLQSMISNSRKGDPLAPQLLAYWASQTERFRLTQMVVADQIMPRTSGLELFDQIAEVGCSHVLLTGESDTNTAVSAFDEGQIDYFLTKQHPQFFDVLDLWIRRCADMPGDPFQSTWEECLAPNQKASIALGGNRLESVLRERFIEYAIIGEPFGALGVTADRTIGWLQIVEGERPLPAQIDNSRLARDLREPAGAFEAAVDEITPRLGTAYFDLSSAWGRLPAVTNFDGWLAAQPPVHIEDAKRH